MDTVYYNILFPASASCLLIHVILTSHIRSYPYIMITLITLITMITMITLIIANQIISFLQVLLPTLGQIPGSPLHLQPPTSKQSNPGKALPRNAN